MLNESQLRLRAERVTQEVFDRLPALLSAFQVKLVTGWTDEDLAAEVAAGRVETWQRPSPRQGCRGSYRKYVKASVGRLIGFKL